MLALPTAESGDLLRVGEVEAAAVGLALAVRVHGAGRLVDGLVDDVVLQLRRSGREAVFHPFNFPLRRMIGYCDTNGIMLNC